MPTAASLETPFRYAQLASRLFSLTLLTPEITFRALAVQAPRFFIPLACVSHQAVNTHPSIRSELHTSCGCSSETQAHNTDVLLILNCKAVLYVYIKYTGH